MLNIVLFVMLEFKSSKPVSFVKLFVGLKTRAAFYFFADSGFKPTASHNTRQVLCQGLLTFQKFCLIYLCVHIHT